VDHALRTVISGSYGKHFEKMLEVKRFLQKRDIVVQAPVSDGIVDGTQDTFILLDEDPVEDPRTLQDSVFAKIRNSTFIVVTNVDGYIGKAAVLEMGYAVALGIQILTLEPVEDPNLGVYTRLLSDVFPEWARHEQDLLVSA
jgi:nucleoside 2-deoxyribosyltransferase